jgi:class 3 adenylate cyclase/tetratricopeptide (TPR) repeat protein
VPLTECLGSNWGNMRCTKCGTESKTGRKFCANCGSALAIRCPQCGAENDPSSKFCEDCGATLAPVMPSAIAQNAPQPLADIHVTARAADAGAAPLTASAGGERRHLTVLFCDLVGSTEISTRLDPEEWREVVAGYHRAAAEAITRFGGHVAKYLGDGVMAYFGWPEAHENDAERAVRAGLSILDAIANLDHQSSSEMRTSQTRLLGSAGAPPSIRPKLSARIGIDSGAVVVGTGAGKDTDVFGEAPNIAARVQALAPPGTVLITAATHRLVSGLFVVEDRGAQALKGLERSIQLYQVIQPSGVRGRLEAAAATRGLTSFVGREEELRLLLNRWERALDGEGQVALIVGEAGIGKSRLLQHFHEQIAATPHTWAQAAAAPSFQNTPFYAISELLREFVAPHGGESADELLTQLEPQLTSAGLKPAEAIPLIALLLNLPVPPNYAPLAYSPEQQRRRLLTTMVNWVLGAARVQPLVIATEDLHWADPSTLELIQILVEQRAAGRLLLLYTARPEFRAQWPLRAHHTQITLNRLSVRSARTMVEQVAARGALSDETVAAVIERTGGVPLFVEELTRVVLETSSEKLTGREIPVTLHDALMARLDRLGPAKELAQVGAVIGNEFSYELISAVHPMPENELRDALNSLADAELLYVRGIAPEATYQFKHALIRDAAYEALLKSRRKQLHQEVARTIEVKFPALKETHPEVLARHWSEADEPERAIAEWETAGKAAEGRNALHEAEKNYQQALSLLNLLPESPERNIREMQFTESLASMVFLTRGYAAPEQAAAVERLKTLAEKSGNSEWLMRSITTRAANACLSGALAAAAALADQVVEHALRAGSPTVLAHGRHLQLLIGYYRGDLAGVEKYLAAGLQVFDDPVFRRSPGAFIDGFGTAAQSAWIAGKINVARERLAKAAAAVNPANPYDVAWSHLKVATVHTFSRDNEKAEMSATRALELCEQHKIPSLAAAARCLLGHAQAQLGRAPGGIGLIRHGIGERLETGSRIVLTVYITCLAVAHQLAGALDEALEVAEQALEINPEELVHRPETLRLRGELRRAKGQADLAEADFRDSISLAKSMGAKAWELRTAMSWARLLASQGRADEARVMLAEIYKWFTEGFDTPDLKDAKALFDELTP